MIETQNVPVKKKHRGLKVAALTLTGGLLLASGGTMALWSATADAEQGVVTAGDLEMETQAGAWSSDISGPIADILTFQTVPGETLTYTQPVDVTLEGDNLRATLVTTGASVNQGFLEENVVVSEKPTLTTADGEVLPDTELTTSQAVTASTTFEFLDSTINQDSTLASYDFTGVGYQLEQLTPTVG